MPIVSINLCCYNSEKYLEETLQSIFNQTYRDWELVVVDDGSTDSTKKIIADHIEQGRSIVYHHQRNQGLGNARNKAVELSSGKLIALIDHDDLWVPHKLETQIKLFEGNPTLGMVYSDGDIITSKGDPILRYSYKHPLYRGSIFDKLILNCFIPPVGAVIPRHVFEKVGKFPPFHTAEEYDLFLKIAYEYPIDYVPEPLFKYRSHDRNLSLTLSREHLHRESIQIREYWMARLVANGCPRHCRKLVRQLLAREYTAFSRWLLDQQRNQEARKYSLLGLRLKPFQWGVFYHLLSFCSPRLSLPLLTKIRCLKNSLLQS